MYDKQLLKLEDISPILTSFCYPSPLKSQLHPLKFLKQCTEIIRPKIYIQIMTKFVNIHLQVILALCKIILPRRCKAPIYNSSRNFFFLTLSFGCP